MYFWRDPQADVLQSESGLHKFSCPHCLPGHSYLPCITMRGRDILEILYREYVHMKKR